MDEGWVVNGFGWVCLCITLEATLIPPGLSLQLQGVRWRKGWFGYPAAALWLQESNTCFFFKVIPNLPLVQYGISPTLFYILSLASIFLFYVHHCGRWVCCWFVDLDLYTYFVMTDSSYFWGRISTLFWTCGSSVISFPLNNQEIISAFALLFIPIIWEVLCGAVSAVSTAQGS